MKSLTTGSGPSYQLLRKPQNVPSAQTFDILYDNLKAAEVQGGHRVESYVKKDQGPFKESVNSVRTRYAVNLVLDEEVDQWDQSAKEGTRQVLSQLDSPRVRRAKSQTSDCPW